MKMKKLGALLLAGVMTMSTLLTGCGMCIRKSAGGNASQTESGSNGERKKITILMRSQ